MKDLRVILLLLSSLLSVQARSQCDGWEWVINSFATTPYNTVGEILTDGNNNIYMIGTFGNATPNSLLTFGSDTLFMNGYYNSMFLAKFDSSGNELWLKSFTASDRHYGIDMAIDSNNFIYVAAYFESAVSIDSYSFTGGGNLIMKLNPLGNVLWAEQIDDGNVEELIIDHQGNIVVSGVFKSTTITIDTITLNRPTAWSNFYDFFIAKYSNQGGVIWANVFGGNKYDRPVSIGVDNNDNILIAGHFGSDTLNFGGISLYATSTNDIFILKLDDLGNSIWARKSIGIGYLGEAAVNNNNEIIITGYGAASTIQFDTIVLNSYNNPFVAKYNVTGNVVWAKSFPASGSSRGSGVVTDQFNSIYLTGTFAPQVTFDTIILDDFGSMADIYLAKLDNNANVIWAASAGVGGNPLEVHDITLNKNGILIAGQTEYGNQRFGNISYYLQGGTEFYMASFSNIENPMPVLGPDTVLCQGSSFTLDATSGFASYLWSNNSTGQTLNVSQPGNYWVRVVDYNNCVGTDTINITVAALPTIDLGPDTSVCTGDTLTLDVGDSTFSQLWTGGYMSPSISVNTSGTYSVTVTDSNQCSNSDDVIILFIEPVVNLGSDTTICENLGFLLNAGPGQMSYLWSDSSTSQFLSVDTAGLYFVEITDNYNCSIIDSILIYEYPLVTLSLGPDWSKCTEYILGAGFAYPSFQWSDGSSDSLLSVISSGSYWIEVTDSNNCVQADTVEITIYSDPVIDLGIDTTVCEADSFSLSAGGFTSYLWSTGNISPSITVSISDTYWVYVVDINNCTWSDSIDVVVSSLPPLELGEDTSVCSNDVLLLSASYPGATYLWNDGSSADSYLTGITETIWASVTNGSCIAADTIYVQIDAAPTQVTPTYIELCNDTDNVLSAKNVGSDYLWSTGNNSMTITAEEIGIYSVRITNEYNCTTQVVFDVALCSIEIVVPNTITPNGDGANDTWEIERIEDYPGNTVQIFNRNGEVVYESSYYDNSWDGIWKNKPLPAATYFYLLDLNNGAEIIKGTLTIIRE